MNSAGRTFDGGTEIGMTEDLVICHSQSNWRRERIGVGIYYQSRRLNAVFVRDFRVVSNRLQEFHDPYGLLFLFHRRMIVIRGCNQQLSKDQIRTLRCSSIGFVSGGGNEILSQSTAEASRKIRIWRARRR